jgi:hypothetical protein
MAVIDLPGLDELKRFSYVCFEPIDVETFVAKGPVGYLVNALSVRFPSHELSGPYGNSPTVMARKRPTISERIFRGTARSDKFGR